MYAFDIVDGVVHGVDQGDVVVDQLRHVLVAGGDQHRLLFGAENAREGADHVVGFDAVLNDQRQAHGADQIVQRLHLLAQLVGHRRPVGLVLLEQLVAEGFALGVEHHRHVLGVVVVDHLAQHRGDAAHRAGGLAGGGGQRRQRVEGPVQVGGAVDKDDRFTLGHGSPWLNPWSAQCNARACRSALWERARSHRIRGQRRSLICRVMAFTALRALGMAPPMVMKPCTSSG